MDGLTRDQIAAEAKTRGFANVKTFSGNVAVSDWQPYGGAGVDWRGEWLASDRVRDVPRRDTKLLGIAQVLGIWQFV